jgi:hypothetical protein
MGVALITGAIVAGMILAQEGEQLMRAKPLLLPAIAAVAALIEGFIIAHLLWLKRWRAGLTALPILQAEGPILRSGAGPGRGCRPTCSSGTTGWRSQPT